MTEKEKQVCKQMAKDGLAYARECQEYNEKYERYEKEGDSVKAETALRWMGYYSGCAFVIHQILACLGFEDEIMHEIEENLPL